MIFNFLCAIYRPYTGRIIGTALGHFGAATLIYAVTPWLVKGILNQSIAHRQIPLGLSLGFITAQLLIPVCFRIAGWIWLHFEPLMRHDVADRMIDYLSLHSFRFFQNQFAGNLSSKIQDALSNAIELLSVLIADFGFSLFGVISALVAMYSAHLWFAFLLTVWVIVFFGIPILALKHSIFLSRQMSESGAKIMGLAVDVISNMMTVKLFVGYGRERQLRAEQQKAFTLQSYRADKFLWWVNTFQALSFVIYNVACWVLLITWLRVGKVTPGDFVLVLSINGALIPTLWNTAEKIRNVVKKWSALGQAFTILEEPHEVVDIEGAEALVVEKGEIRFEDVVFGYDPTILFNHLSITIAPGQKIGLVGYSGGGKTTFVNLLLRLLDVQNGRILIDDQDIKTVTQDSLRQHISLIPQDPALFHRSLLENIRYSKPGATDTEVIEAARKAQLHDFIMSLPQDYQTAVGERGVKLSGGQRQRVAIARALLKDAPIVIMDEATSQLDSVTEKMIQSDALIHMQGKTVIVIAHRLSTLTQMDRILVFEAGRIIQDGSPQDLQTQSGLYKILWDTQVSGMLPIER